MVWFTLCISFHVPFVYFSCFPPAKTFPYFLFSPWMAKISKIRLLLFLAYDHPSIVSVFFGEFDVQAFLLSYYLEIGWMDLLFLLM